MLDLSADDVVWSGLSKWNRINSWQLVPTYVECEKISHVWDQNFHRTRKGSLQFSRANTSGILELLVPNTYPRFQLFWNVCGPVYPTSFRQTTRGLCYPWVNGEWPYGTHVAMQWTTKVTTNYSVLNLWEFLSQTTHKQGINISFIKFLFAVLKLCTPCICIDSCFINQQMHNVWC